MSKSRPILFNAEMVQAILAGRKTQTRRVIKNDFMVRLDESYPYCIRDKHALWNSFKSLDQLVAKFCPHGQPGDSLWVREGFVTFSHRHVDAHDRKYPVHRHLPHYPDCITLFRSDDYELPNNIKWCSPIFMRKNESRITLEINNIEVQELTGVSIESIRAEGITKEIDEVSYDMVMKFRKLWDSINAKRGYGWDENPWVWMIDFTRIDP